MPKKKKKTKPKHPDRIPSSIILTPLKKLKGRGLITKREQAERRERKRKADLARAKAKP